MITVPTSHETCPLTPDKAGCERLAHLFRKGKTRFSSFLPKLISAFHLMTVVKQYQQIQHKSFSSSFSVPNSSSRFQYLRCPSAVPQCPYDYFHLILMTTNIYSLAAWSSPGRTMMFCH